MPTIRFTQENIGPCNELANEKICFEDAFNRRFRHQLFGSHEGGISLFFHEKTVRKEKAGPAANLLALLHPEPLTNGKFAIKLSGTADDLSQTKDALQWNFLLALVITFLLMASLFESFLYPLVIMLSVPAAAAGGVLGLVAVNAAGTFQAMDILTMLGFVILIGVVVNAAILIVHQTLNILRAEPELDPREAIRRAVDTRVRPIFMSVITSAFGMMPLVVFPGAGSELYRGLGSVVIGGLLLSTIFTLVLVPTILSLAMDARAWVRGQSRQAAAAE